jgi:hypothetical protein
MLRCREANRSSSGVTVAIPIASPIRSGENTWTMS